MRMRIIITLSICLAVTVALCDSTAAPATANDSSAEPIKTANVMITGATIIDVRTGKRIKDSVVVIEGERIIEVGSLGKVRIPNGAQVIDAKGKFLIPGLWDMHVHTFNEDFIKMYVANGITGVRDMFGLLARINKWRAEIKAGNMLGPRIVAAGPIVDGPKPVWPGSLAVKDETEGRQAVTKVKQAGSDFVKVYSLLPRDAFFAIADEAKKQGIPFAGHVPESVSAADASDAGQKSIEHLTGVLMACSRDEETLRMELLRAIANADPSTSSRARRVPINIKAIQSYDQEKAASLFARFTRNGTWQSTTLTVLRSTAYLDDPSFTSDPRVRYVAPAMKDRWGNSKNDFRFKTYSAADWANAKKIFAKYLEVTGTMRRAGVEFLAGSDTPNPYCFPGFSLHDELALMVKAGLTPLEALQAATINPAKFLGLIDSLGTVEQGKYADLVLLEADPLKEIGNTQKIAAVVLNGKFVPRETLQEMLKKVEADAAKSAGRP